MTTEEKLRGMEMLWDEISRSASDFSSPSWYESILKEKEQAFTNGSNYFINWYQGKIDILKPSKELI